MGGFVYAFFQRRWHSFPPRPRRSAPGGPPSARGLAGRGEVGFEVVRGGIESFGEMLSDRIGNIVQEIYNAVGYEFNLTSPKQLG